jgi:hypothetical protein
MELEKYQDTVDDVEKYYVLLVSGIYFLGPVKEETRVNLPILNKHSLLYEVHF